MRICGWAAIVLLGCSSAEPGADAIDSGVMDATETVDTAVAPDSASDSALVDTMSSDTLMPRGPAYEAGTAGCPPADGTRRVKLVNNCVAPRWFKLDARTTPTWARPTVCPWTGETCTDLEGTAQCEGKARAKSGGADPGSVYCKATPAGGRSGSSTPSRRIRSSSQADALDVGGRSSSITVRRASSARTAGKWRRPLGRMSGPRG